MVAVSAIAARTRSPWAAARLGAVWGLGHAITLFTAGAAIILLNLAIPARVGLGLEFAVAIALVVVGLLNLGVTPRARRAPDAEYGTRLPAWRAFVVGLVHGLAGSAAVALALIAAVRDPWRATAWLIVFGTGTLLGMALVTAAFVAPLGALGSRVPQFGRAARLATGALSVVVGAWLMWQIGWQDGLFLAIPHWTPH